MISIPHDGRAFLSTATTTQAPRLVSNPKGIVFSCPGLRQTSSPELTRAPGVRLGLCLLVTLALFGLHPRIVFGADTWQDTLAHMPLHNPVRELNRTNCVELLLSAFQSNEVVKALVFMPGATDEFYLFRRARAALTNDAPSLYDAVAALTNQTFIQATFRPPFVLLHTGEDPLEADNILKDEPTSERLRRQVKLGQLRYNDRDWDFLQPVLKRSLKIGLRPWRYSPNSWHFYRHSFAAWNVDGLQALELVALAGKSKFILLRNQANFEADTRVRAAPKFDARLH